jgi:hypothetical protein
MVVMLGLRNRAWPSCPRKPLKTQLVFMSYLTSRALFSYFKSCVLFFYIRVISRDFRGREKGNLLSAAATSRKANSEGAKLTVRVTAKGGP